MRRRWIRPVRGIRYQHHAAIGGSALAIARVYEGAYDHDARHLAVRARRRLQRNACETRYLRKTLLQFIDQLQSSLCVLFRSKRVKICKSGNARDPFVEAR